MVTAGANQVTMNAFVFISFYGSIWEMTYIYVLKDSKVKLGGSISCFINLDYLDKVKCRGRAASHNHSNSSY